MPAAALGVGSGESDRAGERAADPTGSGRESAAGGGGVAGPSAQEEQSRGAGS